MDPIVDVIIPVHRTERDVERAVRSASSRNQGIASRTIVVQHGIELSTPRVAALEDTGLVISCDEGAGEPGRPRDAGLDAASAPFVFFLDSDDELAPQCLRRLHDAVRITGADVALPSIAVGRRWVPSPLSTRRRPHVLHTRRHHAFLRSHHKALIRRSILVDLELRHQPGLRTGEDFAFLASLIARTPIALAFDAVYRLRDGGSDHASETELSGEDHVAAVHHVLDAVPGWPLDAAEIEALALRLLSVSIALTWRRQHALGHELPADAFAVARDRTLALAPGAARLLSLRDRASLEFTEPDWRWQACLGLVPVGPAGITSPLGPPFIEARKLLVRRRRRRGR